MTAAIGPSTATTITNQTPGTVPSIDGVDWSSVHAAPGESATFLKYVEALQALSRAMILHRISPDVAQAAFEILKYAAGELSKPDGTSQIDRAVQLLDSQSNVS